METNEDGHIVMMLSNKGYVALENNQIFQLWKNKCLKDIYEELNFRYPNYKISLGSLVQVNFKDIAEVCTLFLKQEGRLETRYIPEKPIKSESITIINFNKVLVTGISKMRATNKVKAKALTVIGVNITAGIIHLGFQSMADIVCYSEAKIIDKLNVFDKTVEEIINARKSKTIETQRSILKSPKKAKQSVSQFYCKIKDIKDQAKASANKTMKTA